MVSGWFSDNGSSPPASAGWTFGSNAKPRGNAMSIEGDRIMISPSELKGTQREPPITWGQAARGGVIPCGNVSVATVDTNRPALEAEGQIMQSS